MIAYFAFAALGLLVGFLIGMSESPLIAAAVTGTLTFVGTIIGKWWDQPEKKNETKTEDKTYTPDPANPTNPSLPTKTVTATNSTVTMRQGVFQINWLLPLALATLVGVVLGAGVRINGALMVRDQNIPARLKKLGFTDEQIEKIMARLSEKMDYEQAKQPDNQKYTGLVGRDVTLAPASEQPKERPKEQPKEQPKETGVDFDWHRYWKKWKKGTPATVIIDNLLSDGSKGEVPEAFRVVIKANRDVLKKDDAKIVEELKNLTDYQP